MLCTMGRKACIAKADGSTLVKFYSKCCATERCLEQYRCIRLETNCSWKWGKNKRLVETCMKKTRWLVESTEWGTQDFWPRLWEAMQLREHLTAYFSTWDTVGMGSEKGRKWKTPSTEFEANLKTAEKVMPIA